MSNQMNNNVANNPNLALGKRIVEEICRRPNVNEAGQPINICNSCAERERCNKVHNPRAEGFIVTDNDISNYNEFDGYVSVMAPATITIDLEEVQPVQTIQLLLWDNCGGQKSENCNRKYQYRLLTSADGKEWRVLFDTFRDGYCGWQRFDLSSPLPMRYIRYHALTINDKTPPPFMVVEIEAYAHELISYNYRFAPTLHIDINVEESGVKDADANNSVKNEQSLSRFINTIVKNLEDDVEACGRKRRLTLKAKLEQLIQAMHSAQYDVLKHEQGVDEIKNKILSRPNEEFRKNRRNEQLGLVTFWLGIAAIIYSIWQLIEKMM